MSKVIIPAAAVVSSAVLTEGVAVIKKEIAVKKTAISNLRWSAAKIGLGAKNLNLVILALAKGEGFEEKILKSYSTPVYQMTALYDADGPVLNSKGEQILVKKMVKGAPVVESITYNLTKAEIGSLLANEINASIDGLTAEMVAAITEELKATGFFTAATAEAVLAATHKAMGLTEKSIAKLTKSLGREVDLPTYNLSAVLASAVVVTKGRKSKSKAA